MLTNSLILKFLWKCVATYLVFILVGGIPMIHHSIGDSFRGINNTRFRGLMSQTQVVFQKNKKSAFDTNIYVQCSNDKQWNFAEYKLDSWYMEFIPNALFISLLFATPFGTIKKKLLAFLIGLILNNLLIFGILFIRIYILKIQVQSTLGDFTTTFPDRMIIFLHNNLAVYSWISFVLPVFVWAVVSIQKKMGINVLQSSHLMSQ